MTNIYDDLKLIMLGFIVNLHQSLITLINNFDYSKANEGFCRGGTLSWLTSRFFYEEKEEFDALLKLIHQSGVLLIPVIRETLKRRQLHLITEESAKRFEMVNLLWIAAKNGDVACSFCQ